MLVVDLARLLYEKFLFQCENEVSLLRSFTRTLMFLYRQIVVEICILCVEIDCLEMALISKIFFKVGLLFFCWEIK